MPWVMQVLVWWVDLSSIFMHDTVLFWKFFSIEWSFYFLKYRESRMCLFMNWLVQMLNIDVLWNSSGILHLLKTLANHSFLLNSFSWALGLQVIAEKGDLLSYLIG